MSHEQQRAYIAQLMHRKALAMNDPIALENQRRIDEASKYGR